MYKFLLILFFTYLEGLTINEIYDESWAIIIGIDEYHNISHLDYAVADAIAIQEVLINKFNYKKQNVKLLINEEANKVSIVETLSEVSLMAGENDRVLVFYAGHGETMSLPDGGEMGYLLPVDAKQNNLYSSALPMNDLKDFSNISKAKHMLFLIDACYGGLASVGTRGLEPAETPDYLEKITNIKSRQIITAGGSNEKVIEKPEWGHSVYTMNLLRALKDGLADSNNDGYITAGELGLYLSEKVTIDSENQQTPQSRRLTSHEGEFVFINNVIIENQIISINNLDEKIMNSKLIDRIELLEDKYKNINLIKNKSIVKQIFSFNYVPQNMIFDGSVLSSNYYRYIFGKWGTGIAVSYVNLNYNNIEINNDYSYGIAPYISYSFTENSLIFNPQLILGMRQNYNEWSSLIYNKSGTIEHIDPYIGIVSYFKVYKNFGLSLGGIFSPTWNIGLDSDLQAYLYGGKFRFFPVLSLSYFSY